jgi:hypothetical protein
MTLSATEKAVLDLERTWWCDTQVQSSSKQSVIRARLRIAPSTYYGTLERLVDSPAALAYDPLVIHRLRQRQRARRRAAFIGSEPRRQRP